MNINIDYKNRTPIYEQIVDDIEKYVSLGILKEGEQIMSIREMAINLGINPNTVKKAYDILEQKNIITTVSTKGTYITTNTKQVIENKIEKDIIAIKSKIDELTKLGLTREEILNRISKSKKNKSA